jgi:hypothetical protein
MNTKLTKLALKRDDSVPIGHASPLHLDCPCGARVNVDKKIVTCPKCGTEYDENGWLL